MTLAPRVVRIPVVLVLPSLLLLLLLLLLVADGSWAHVYPREIKPGCRYEGRRYQEGTAVGTSEPCLRCRCTEGALRCRLRVCPRLPNPPPSGCHIRAPDENVCCAELVCGEPRDVENMLRRAGVQTNAGAENEKHVHHSRTEGCLHEGVWYGSGSAMMGSRRCEYCYCISGARRCIRPKCLLPLPGCNPLYAPHSCCPVAYNCTHHHPSTMAPISGNGCRVGERTYAEGEMVRDIEWKAACDNCFCAMGAVRCVPLACAPPLQGCSPIVREGQCCPSTYNCSGSIEVKATQNYASYAFISKDYAKFRKETNFFPAIDQSTYPSVEARGHRVVEEQVSTGTIDLEEDSSVATYSTAWPSTMETDIMDNEILIGTVDYKSTLEVTTAAISTNELSSNTESIAFESTLASTKDADSITDSCATCTTNTLTDSTIAATEALDPSNTDGTTTISSPEWTTVLPELTFDNGNDENEGTGGSENKNASESEDRDDEHGTTGLKVAEKADIIEKNKATTHPFAISTGDAGDAFVPDVKSPENSALVKGAETVVSKRPVTSPSSTILMPDDILVMNVTVKTNVSVGHIQGVTINPIKSILPDVEAILNITHREKAGDYDYDYSGQALLPNVRIIPFVAADALVNGKKDVSSPKTGYSPGSVAAPSELRPTDASGFYGIATQENRFSPPVETEGGFMPREPSYFEVPYHSTDLNLEIGTGVTVVPAQITNPHRENDDPSSECRSQNMEYRHGEIVPNPALCVTCMCFYGKIVCTSEKCPPLKIGCRRITSEERCCGDILCVKAEESPTVVLNRADATAPSQRQPTVSPDPFRDVIKTEPAPDLSSLIEDMIRGITTARPTTSMAAASKTSTQGLAGNQLQHPPNFEFMQQVPLIRPPFDYEDEIVDSSFIPGIERDGEAPSKDTVPLTYNVEERIVNRKPANVEKVAFGYDRVTLNKSSATDEAEDGSGNVIRGGNVTEQKLVRKENVSLSNENVGAFIDKVNNRGESIGSSTAVGYGDEGAEEDEQGVFSFESVLESLFSTNTSDVSTEPDETTKMPDVLSVGGSREGQETLTVSSTTGLTEETETVEASSKVLNNEIPMSVDSLLKLAGCNIYGRMYRVGRIITELSNPCLECRCTDIGVQCKPLEC